MRKGITIFSIFFCFFLSLQSAHAALETTRTKTQEFVNAAVKPGTYVFAEKLVHTVGQGIDWYFGRLVAAADAAKLGVISNDIVTGISKGFTDYKVDHYTNWGLDAVEDLSRRFWLEDFKKEVLQGSGVKIQPYFKTSMEYNSNVFYEPEAPKRREDIIWNFTPGVSINVPLGEEGRHRLGAVYEARINEFTRAKEHDDIGQSLGVVGNFQLNDNLFFNVTEEFVKDAARAGTVNAERVEYIDQIVTPSLTYNWRNWTFESEYRNAIRYFDSFIYNAFSYANNAITTRVLRDLAPGFRGLLEYTFSHYDYGNDETRVGHYNEIRTGVKGNLSDKTTLLARVGYQERGYRAHDTQFDVPVADVRLQHQLTERASLDLFFERTLRESQFTNNRAYDQKLAQFSGNYLFTQKLRGRSGGSLARHDFQNEATVGTIFNKRRDLLGSVFVGLDYAFRPWLVTNIDYRYERSNSNNSNFDYTNNVLQLGMTMPL